MVASERSWRTLRRGESASTSSASRLCGHSSASWQPFLRLPASLALWDPFGHVSAKESAMKTPMRRAKRKQSLGPSRAAEPLKGKAGPRPAQLSVFLRRRRRALRRSCRPGFRRSPGPPGGGGPASICISAVFELSASVALLEQELGFSVGSGVRNKARKAAWTEWRPLPATVPVALCRDGRSERWRFHLCGLCTTATATIRGLQDGVRPADDGEPANSSYLNASCYGQGRVSEQSSLAEPRMSSSHTPTATTARD